MFAATGSLGPQGTAHAFSQYSPVTPLGHEFLVVDPAKKVARETFPELNPEKPGVTDDSAGCGLGCTAYGTTSHAVWSTVIGQRWADTMGFAKNPFVASRCFDAVAQDSDDIMYDHFLRMRGDFNGCGAADGRAKAIRGSIERFRLYFEDAVNANDDPTMVVRDGGFTTAHYKVKRAYFLFGRAVHLFQDSFSTEHSIRSGDGEILDIRSYFCTPGVPLHRHAEPSFLVTRARDIGKAVVGTANAMASAVDGSRATATEFGTGYERNGDIIWRIGGGSITNVFGNLKPHAVMAHAAMVDLWSAFMRAHKKVTTAKAELDGLQTRWFRFDEKKKTDPDTARPEDFAACEFATVAKVKHDVQACFKWTGTQTQTSSLPLLPPYDWTVEGATDTIYDGDLEPFGGTKTEHGTGVVPEEPKFKPWIALEPSGSKGLESWETYVGKQLTSCVKQIPKEICNSRPSEEACQAIGVQMREHGPRVQSDAVAKALGASRPTSILSGWSAAWPDDPATVRKVDETIRRAIKPEIDLWFSGGPQQKRTLASLAATRTELENTERTLRPTKSNRSEFIFDQTDSFRFVQQLQINTFGIHWVPSTEEAGKQAFAAITAKNSESFKRIVAAGNGTAKPAQFEVLNARIAWLARSEVEEATRRSIAEGYKKMETAFGPNFGRIQTRAQRTFSPTGNQIGLVPGVSPLLQAAPSSGTGVLAPPRKK